MTGEGKGKPSPFHLFFFSFAPALETLATQATGKRKDALELPVLVILLAGVEMAAINGRTRNISTIFRKNKGL